MSERTYDELRKAKMDEILLVMPGVKASKAFGYPAYKVNGKIFAFVGSRGFAIKLPTGRVESLLDGKTFKPFEVGDGTVWKQWLSIQHEHPDDYENDIALFEESVGFVANK
jgi:hypothetical protein